MENIFDLDEFSNKEDNSDILEEPKSKSPQSLSNPHLSLNLDFPESSKLSAKKEHYSHGQLTISKNNIISNISDNPINVSEFKYKKNNDYKNLKICEQKTINEINEKKENNTSETYAEEDQIDVSKFEEIKPVMNFSFTLDDFQKRSIIRLEQKKNILVCAHTSSGKTLVAEYGIALGKKKKKKVIYTSPIKALSNQKYCEFKKKFTNVGIITGDVNIKPYAQCLVITTEILHKFLYNQSSILNNVGTVIFDEVHYINDNERGHIWEEILIVLPSNISIIMLSATIPNYFEFACWVGKIKNTKVYIEVTKKRVVPLKHFIYIDPEHVFKVKNKDDILDYKEIDNAFEYLKKIKAPKINENNNLNSNIKNNNLEKIENKNNNEKQKEKENNINNKNNIIEEILSSNSENDENEGDEINDDETNENSENNGNCDNINKMRNKRYKKSIRKKILEIVKYLLSNKLYPATLFVFNIRKIQDYSTMLIKNNNLPAISEEEKEKINNFFEKAISVIPKEELNISQINYVKQILQLGIGVHHSGLLPILKEIIEILYFHGLIKILFATTSFSIGLNMPTRTVVFTSLYKYHERKIEMINSSEFLQMSGRAGRRGIDEHGNVYILYTQPQGKHEIAKLKKILACQGIDLESKFRLSYRIILSFYHRNLKDIKDFFKESFHENHNIEMKPERLKEINNLLISIEQKKRFRCLKCGNFGDIEDSPIAKFIHDINEYDKINRKIYNNEKIVEFLEKNHGIILQVKNNSNNTINKFHKQDLVLLVNIIKIKDEKKLWCLTITSHEDSKNTNNKEEEPKEKEKDIDKNNSNIFKNKGKYREYKYKYLLFNFNDVIDIYEKPNIEINEFYKQDKINSYFDVSEKGYYYFKDTNKSIYKVLKYFYRALINFFPKKANDIQIKVKNKKKIQNKNDEVKKVKLLNYQKIISPENDNETTILFNEKNKLKEQIKANNCKHCPSYQKHLNSYKEIREMKDKMQEIKNEIDKGEKKETYKLFNNRLELLKNLDYIEIPKTENENNFEISTNSKIIEEERYINYSLTLKGSASLEIITNDSILITELLFSNIFINNKDNAVLNEEIIVPFLASFVNNDKIRDLKAVIELTDDQANNEQIVYLMGKFHEIYNKLVEIEKQYEISESVYNRSFCFKYYYSIYSWMKGENFCDVCSKHQIVEGKLYTNIMRTFYFMEEISNFYKKIGNEKMGDTFMNIKNNLLKGIMSVESLYLKDNIDIDDI